MKHKSEADIKPVPREVRQMWQEQIQPEINIPAKYKKRWTDDDIERVIKATPEEYASYWHLAKELNRSPGALHRVKEIVIELFEKRPFALRMASSGLPKHHDYKHVYQILQLKGYLSLPDSEWKKYSRHLAKPSSGWRGDHTQSVLARRSRANNR